MAYPFDSEVICSCGCVVREVDTLFCDDCGDVTCYDCLSEGEDGMVFCVNCEGYYHEEEKENDIIMNLIIDGKRYSSNHSNDLIYLSSHKSGIATKLYMDIKGIGRIKYLYRSVYPIHDSSDKEVGELYTLYFEKAVK